MVSKIKYRRLIQYSLIVCTILMQTIILVFFYNEYFNERKLEAIHQQITETQALRRLTTHSKDELFNAGDFLQKFLGNNNRENLDRYFESLRNLTKIMDSIDSYKNFAVFDKLNTELNEKKELTELEQLIDSIYNESKKTMPGEKELKIDKIDLGKTSEKFDMEISHTTDSTGKKKFIPRVIDAIKGDVEVKRDTVFVKTKYGHTIDTAKIKMDFEHTVSEIDQHYQLEIEKYKDQLSEINKKNSNLYQVYNNLLILSNDLMGIYEQTIDGLNDRLEKEYDTQNSINRKIRKYTVLGLMVLTFFVLIILMYFTKQSFVYEKELSAANLRISQNLNFNNRVLGMLSHEIRSPLKIINLFINRISKKTDDPVIHESLKSIKFTNDSLIIQAGQILEYAKNHESEIVLQPVNFELKKEIDSIIESFKPYIELKGNTFTTENHILADTFVFADNTKIHQLFNNMLGNSNKFTENGEIKLIAKAKNADDNSVKLIVSISDTGIGISQNDLKKIFEPYYQGMVSEGVENIGAGLGLNLCREIINLFGGEIAVNSELNKGTNINFEIKLNLNHD